MADRRRGRRRGAPRCEPAILLIGAALLVLVGIPAPATGVEPRGLYVVPPFHPEECEAASAEARRQLERKPASPRWRRICAEAQLCAGARDHNPRLLQLAAIGFRRLAASESGASDPHVAIGLADALRLLSPASPAAVAALGRAVALADAPAVRSYLEANLAAVRANAAGCAARSQPPRRYADVCVQGGAAQTAQALALLDRDPLRQRDPIGWMVERAEVLRRAGHLASAAALHRAVVRRLERDDPYDPHLPPSRQRVAELMRMQATTFRCRPSDDQQGGKP